MAGRFETFERFASGFQSTVIALGVIVGGVWSLYTFDILEQADRARAQLEDIQKKLKGAVSTRIEISPSQIGASNKDRYGIVTDVTISNTGTRDVEIELDNKALVVTRVESFKDNIPYAGESYEPYYFLDIRKGKRHFLVAHRIGVDASALIRFYVEVKNPGLYMISFRSEIPKKLHKEMEEAAIKDRSITVETPKSFFAAVAFLNVTKTSN